MNRKGAEFGHNTMGSSGVRRTLQNYSSWAQIATSLWISNGWGFPGKEKKWNRKGHPAEKSHLTPQPTREGTSVEVTWGFIFLGKTVLTCA